MSLNKEFIDRMRRKLLDERKAVKEKLDKIGTKASDSTDDYDARFVDYGRSEDDNAMEVEHYTTSLSEEKNLETLLEKIDKALKRIEDGTYGQCPDCQGEMNHERLEAFPAAELCLDCQKKQKA